ncbi:MAG: response regulator [Pyrinomonadaceae bacterium]
MRLSPRILYVDDDLASCEIMTFWLKEEFDFEITVAMNAKQAVDLIRSEYFDLYILDYCLPDVTAVNLCLQIRGIRSKAPIMVYSALERDIDRESAIAAGADYYFIKPQEIEEIGLLIRRLLDSSVVPAHFHATDGDIPVIHEITGQRRRASGIL